MFHSFALLYRDVVSGGGRGSSRLVCLARGFCASLDGARRLQLENPALSRTLPLAVADATCSM